MEGASEVVRLVSAILLFAVGGFVTFANWMCWASSRPGRFCSTVPLIGGGCLALGALLLPATRPFAFLGLVLDIGTLTLLLCLPMLLKEFWKISRFNLLEKYVAKSDSKTVALMLYRLRTFVIEQNIRHSVEEYPFVQVCGQGNWERQSSRLILRMGHETASFEETRGVIRQLQGFDSYEANEDLSLAGLEFHERFRRSPRGRTLTTSAS